MIYATDPKVEERFREAFVAELMMPPRFPESLCRVLAERLAQVAAQVNEESRAHQGLRDDEARRRMRTGSGEGSIVDGEVNVEVR